MGAKWLIGVVLLGCATTFEPQTGEPLAACYANLTCNKGATCVYDNHSDEWYCVHDDVIKGAE
jgi:hypothetical protein